MNNTQEKPLTLQELAAALGLHPATVDRKAQKRKIPYHNISGTRRFYLSEVMAATLVTPKQETKGETE